MRLPAHGIASALVATIAVVTAVNPVRAQTPAGQPSAAPSPAPAPTATPRERGWRSLLDASFTSIDQSTSGPGQVGPEARGFIAGAALAEEPAPALTSTELQSTPPPDSRERREFILANGERILGAVLSETPEAIYIDHGTLGVLTIPRAQIAQRPIEVILINGDRIVGDIVAETADTLFVRHASLGILTVPQNQRSTRVVEAILKDGDRILGEVLGETENFTVIRSATLGTVAVPHNRVAMLNRKVEQVQMKALPAGTPDPKSAS